MLRIDYTSDLCAAALFLLLRTARSLAIVVGAETWQDLDPRLMHIFRPEVTSMADFIRLRLYVRSYDS